MADVPLTLAIVSTVTPVVAVALPLTATWFKDVRLDKQAAEERQRMEQSQREREKRTECVELLRLARGFRVLVENTCDSNGSELEAYARQVRDSSARVSSQADKVEFMVPGADAEALSLAAAARLLAAVVDKKNRELGSPLLSPDFTKFDLCLTEFKQAAQAALIGRPAVSEGRSDAGNSGDLDRPVPSASPGGPQDSLV